MMSLVAMPLHVGAAQITLTDFYLADVVCNMR